MKLMSKLTLINLLCYTAFPAAADNTNNMPNPNNPSIVEYLQNLGGYLGYDITKSPTANNNVVSQALLNITLMQSQTYTFVFNTVLGAIMVNTASDGNFTQFLPTEAAGASIINAFANATFAAQNYNQPSSSGSNSGSTQTSQQVTVNPTLDQPTFQADPVSQGVLNLLSTPDYTYCVDSSGNWVQNCPYLFANQVSANAIGTIPGANTFFSYAYNQPLISQLNSNSLTAPLMYNTQSPPSNNSTSSPIIPQMVGNGTMTQTAGLTAQSQAQEAANFIRYVSGSLTPPKLPRMADYNKLYLQIAGITNPNNMTTQQHQAYNTLSTYFANLRTYAAQSSVGLSNLYFIMSKRLPQNQSTGSNTTTPMSQAMTEFNMATWRLYNADMTSNPQWVNQINTASSATVEKEIATLLAEISYQLYLDRQIQERILLTNSVMLMQNVRTSQPSANFSSQSSTAASQ